MAVGSCAQGATIGMKKAQQRIARESQFRTSSMRPQGHIMYRVKAFFMAGRIGRRISLSFRCSPPVPRSNRACARRRPIGPTRRFSACPTGAFLSTIPSRCRRSRQLSIEREARALGIPRGGALPAVSMLSLSGGGDDGAFGSGLLVGWTAHGDRPQFKLVTGVSTGALIAPSLSLGRPTTRPWPRSIPTSSPRRSTWRGRSCWRR